MSSASSMDQAYESFLGSTDCATWTSCLREYGEILDEAVDPQDARPVDLRRALTITNYVAWLARRDGDDQAANEAVRQSKALEVRVNRAARPRGREATLIDAVIAAAKGYHATARRMVQALADPPPVDVAVLTAPERSAQRAAWLKPFVLDGMGPTFVPALYFYGASLLDL